MTLPLLLEVVIMVVFKTGKNPKVQALFGERTIARHIKRKRNRKRTRKGKNEKETDEEENEERERETEREKEKAHHSIPPKRLQYSSCTS